MISRKIIYEQPLNERIRTLLRLEHLFLLIDQQFNERSEWHCRFILEAMLEITDLLSRSDLKAELIKELEKHSSMLNALKDNPAVDTQRLNELCEKLVNLLSTLKSNQYQPGSTLKTDELVSSFRQRVSIPGGTCIFDLPRLHHWLNLPDLKRKQKIEEWFEDLQPIKHASSLTLDMIRNSSTPSTVMAENGFYQQPIESNVSCQLIRVLLPDYADYYPEISGGKHRFTIRFMEGGETRSRPVQSDKSIEFELHCCIL